jgi:hypothetical protein
MRRFGVSIRMAAGVLLLGGLPLVGAEEATSPADRGGTAPRARGSERVDLGEELNRARRSPAELEAFIKGHSEERDWCGKALMQMGSVLERDGKMQEALAAYLRAAKDYGQEYVPGINSRETVGDMANIHAAVCEHQLGRTEEALKLLEGVARSQASMNMARSARQQYLLIKQEKYELKGRVTSAVTTWSRDKQQVVAVEVRNTSDVPVTFQLCVQLTSEPKAGAGSVFTDGADAETTLQAGETLTRDLVFSAHTLKGTSAGQYYLVQRTEGVKVTADAVKVQVE